MYNKYQSTQHPFFAANPLHQLSTLFKYAFMAGPCSHSSPQLVGGREDPVFQSTTLACVFGAKTLLKKVF